MMTQHNDSIAVLTEAAIDVPTFVAAYTGADDGAVLTFIGVVRNQNRGRAVTGITFDVFAPLATKILTNIIQECTAQSNSTLRVRVIHRIGRIEAGSASIAIGVTAPHRAEAYEASRYIIDQIKARVPIWKQEHYVDGTSTWLPGTPLQSPNVNT